MKQILNINSLVETWQFLCWTQLMISWWHMDWLLPLEMLMTLTHGIELDIALGYVDSCTMRLDSKFVSKKRSNRSINRDMFTWLYTHIICIVIIQFENKLTIFQVTSQFLDHKYLLGIFIKVRNHVNVEGNIFENSKVKPWLWWII